MDEKNFENEIDDTHEYEPEPSEKIKKPLNTTPGAIKLRSWLNRTLQIKMTDGRILIGVFLCTDRDANVILGSCAEFLPESDEPRMLGLVMIPGRHIVTVELDLNETYASTLPLPAGLNTDDIV